MDLERITGFTTGGSLFRTQLTSNPRHPAPRQGDVAELPRARSVIDDTMGRRSKTRMAATHPVMEMEHSDTLMGHAVTTMQVVGDTLNSARDILATYSALTNVLLLDDALQKADNEVDRGQRSSLEVDTNDSPQIPTDRISGAGSSEYCGVSCLSGARCRRRGDDRADSVCRRVRCYGRDLPGSLLGITAHLIPLTGPRPSRC
jgi:hypothetical protein